MNHPVMFLDRDNKMNLVAASFSYFLKLLYEGKINFSLKSIMVITVLMSLHDKETN